MLRSNNNRSRRRSALSVCGAIGLALTTATGQAWSPANHVNHLTFSRDVALPGVVLAAGAYTFEVANVETSGNVVRVSSRDGRRQLFMGFTERVKRPSILPKDRAVSFGEASLGGPPPVVAWYPPGGSDGHRFIYR